MYPRGEGRNLVNFQWDKIKNSYKIIILWDNYATKLKSTDCESYRSYYQQIVIVSYTQKGNLLQFLVKDAEISDEALTVRILIRSS